MPFLEIDAYCPICEAPHHFVAENSWLRDKLICPSCRSIPRHRALMRVLSDAFPDWRQVSIHETGPVWTGVSERLRKDSPGYTWSQYDPAHPTGQPHPEFGWRNENLEALTFANATFDIFITQDVFEHVLHPDRAIREIARVLRPGGVHVCTVPMVNKTKPSVRRARLVNNQVEFILPAEYHGNPVGNGASLVTVDWGYDIVPILDCESGLHTTVFYIDDLTMAIRAEAIEVMVMRKPRNPFAPPGLL